VDSNLLAVREGEMSDVRHMTQRALACTWLGGRHLNDLHEDIAPWRRACNPTIRDGDAISVQQLLPSCPDCAVLRDYAEENASAT
jgi:hypothetical protein